jgi:hypothetical protein
LFRSLLLKLAIDVKLGANFLYSGKNVGIAEYAMKAASQELVAADRLFELFRQFGHPILVPMQTIVEHLGYRVVAVPLLPVGSGTLVYGSADAGKTFLKESQEVMGLLERAGQKLFLAAHLVLDVRIRTAGDLEVHRIRNLDSYVFVDLARTFPPQCPDTSSSFVDGRENPRSQVFFRQFRPEFLFILKENSHETGIIDGISSDVFSR